MLNALIEGIATRAELVHDVESGGIILSALGEMQGVAIGAGSSGDIVAVFTTGVVYLETADIFTVDYQRVYLRTADLVVVSSSLPVLTAPDVTATAKAGGSLSDGDYYYAITVSDSYGETVIGGIDSATASGADKTIQLDWVAVSGAIAYNIYRGIVEDELYYLTAVSSPTVTFDDDGTVLIGTAEPPDYNSTGTQYFGRYLSGYVGQIAVATTLIQDPDGTIHKVEAFIDQRWVPAGNIPVLLKLN